MEVKDEESLRYVFSQVMRLHFLRSHTLLEKTGIYPGQPALLFSLYKNNGQSQRKLSDNLRIKPSTTTVMIKRLEKNDFVTRKQDEVDQRVSRIFITEKGKKICDELKRVHDQIEEECFSGFTVEEKIVLRRLMLQIKENLMSVCDTESTKCISDFCKHHK